MKVLFLSLPTGNGHNQAAASVMNYLGHKGIECSMLDAFEYINPLLSQSVKNAYLMSAKYSPNVYGKVYSFAERGINYGGTISRIIDKMSAGRLLDFVRCSGTQIVVCTHIFAALLMTYVAQNIKEKINTIGIITDYTIHPFWEDTDLNYYVTASELLEYQAIKKGIAKEKLLHLGIPVDLKFARKMTKFEARRVMNFDNNKTIFVMSGSFGYGKVVNVLTELSKSSFDFQIVTVCGFNDKLKRKIDTLKLNKKIYNYGFINDVDIIMDAADCIITKPGGLTTSESLAKCLPMLLVNPIPGQEDRNVEFLLNNGAAMKISKTFSVEEAIYQLFGNNCRMNNFVQNIKFLSKPNSAKTLGDFIINVLKF